MFSENSRWNFWTVSESLDFMFFTRLSLLCDTKVFQRFRCLGMDIQSHIIKCSSCFGDVLWKNDLSFLKAFKDLPTPSNCMNVKASVLQCFTKLFSKITVLWKGQKKQFDVFILVLRTLHGN